MKKLAEISEKEASISMKKDFYRISRLPPYVFAQVNNLKAASRAQGKDIIDFGMGNPDSATPDHIVKKLVETVNNPQTHRYSTSKGIPGLRRAISGYYKRRFDVDIDPEKEAVVTIGSKEGLASLAKAMTGPGDVILVPSPSYPIHVWGFVLVEAGVRYIRKETDSGEKLNFMEELKKAAAQNPKPVALILNYPCNPTAETATLEFYEEVVDFCRFHGIYIISDLAYCEIYFENNPPPSVLQVKGAKDIAIEFTTMSKTYSMPGWRVGFGVGNPTLVQALTKIKSYLDYGTFTPIQVAASAALNGPQDSVEEVRKLYKERRDVLIEGLHQGGWMVESPQASMFAWARIPEKFIHLGSLEFSKLLIEHAEVAVAPGIGFGEFGDKYVRIALVENKHRIRQAVRNIKHFIKSY